jgi:gas vesicle protein
MAENNPSSTSVLWALAGGAAIGAGLALLFAPRSGRETRQAIGEITDESLEYAREILQKAGYSVSKGKEAMDQLWRFGRDKKAQAQGSGQASAQG